MNKDSKISRDNNQHFPPKLRQQRLWVRELQLWMDFEGGLFVNIMIQDCI